MKATLMTRLNTALETLLGWFVGAVFAGLIAVVAIQVLARNLFALPMIWTLDLAQLLFAWCIFVGAGLAFRQGAHYIVDLWPAEGRLSWIPVLAGFAAGVVVAYVLIRHGAEMVDLMARRKSQSLGISRSWYFVPIPICGLLIGLALLEQVQTLWKAKS